MAAARNHKPCAIDVHGSSHVSRRCASRSSTRCVEGAARKNFRLFPIFVFHALHQLFQFLSIINCKRTRQVTRQHFYQEDVTLTGRDVTRDQLQAGMKHRSQYINLNANDTYDRAPPSSSTLSTPPSHPPRQAQEHTSGAPSQVPVRPMAPPPLPHLATPTAPP